jgi:hypothetical protein
MVDLETQFNLVPRWVKHLPPFVLSSPSLAKGEKVCKRADRTYTAHTSFLCSSSLEEDGTEIRGGNAPIDFSETE